MKHPNIHVMPVTGQQCGNESMTAHIHVISVTGQQCDSESMNTHIHVMSVTGQQCDSASMTPHIHVMSVTGQQCGNESMSTHIHFMSVTGQQYGNESMTTHIQSYTPVATVPMTPSHCHSCTNDQSDSWTRIHQVLIYSPCGACRFTAVFKFAENLSVPASDSDGERRRTTRFLTIDN